MTTDTSLDSRWGGTEKHCIVVVRLFRVWFTEVHILRRYFNGCGCIEKRMPASGWDVVYEGDIRALADMGWDGVKFGAPPNAPESCSCCAFFLDFLKDSNFWLCASSKDGCGRMCNMTLYAELMNKVRVRLSHIMYSCVIVRR